MRANDRTEQRTHDRERSYAPKTTARSQRLNKNIQKTTHKLASDTNNGVRLVMRCKGMTGYGATYVSTSTNAMPNTALATNSPQMSGEAHGSSSLDFRLNARRQQPTVPTSVVDPKKSMRRSLSLRDLFWMSVGSSMETFVTTRIAEKASTGI